MKKVLAPRSVFLALAACCLAQAQPSGTLLLRPSKRTPTVKSTDRAVVRSQDVEVNFAALRSKNNQTLIVPLFDNARVVIVRERQEDTAKNGFVWYGRIVRQPNSNVVLSVVGEALSGNINTDAGKLYQIRFAGRGVHRLNEIDPSKYPDEAPPGEVKPPEKKGEEFDTCSTDGPNDIDVLVAYTQAARIADGGTDAIQATIYLAASLANQSYINSNINQRIRLVHLEEVSYVESGNITTDRDRLQNPSDGFLDNIPTLRNTFGADIAALIIDSPGDPACGISYIMNPVSNAFEDHGYAVVERTCAAGNLSFPHELGHVMGARHDWFVDPTNNAAYAYNHGYLNKAPTAPAAPWRTIMAYNNDCSNSAVNCTRQPYFSNPNVNFPPGDAMGVSTGLQQSDNHAVLNTTALTVANFRCSSPSRGTVWMKDTWDDTGAEPDTHTTGEDMWKSPYIWVRNSQDTTLIHQHEHQNPIFGTTNWVYVKMHNGGAAANGNLELYWADGSSALSWPADWNLLSTTPVTISDHSTKIVEAQWNGLPGTGHFCLLARWVSASHPFTNPETADIEHNVRYNNILIWRNLNIVDMAHDQASDATFIVRNPGRERAVATLIIRSPRVELKRSFISDGRVLIAMDEQLLKAWKAGGSRGRGFKMQGQTFLAVDPAGAVFENLVLDAKYESRVKLRFEKLPGTPKHPYIIDAVQLAGSAAKRGPRVTGGISYEIHTEVRPK